MATDIRTSELKSPVDVAEYLFTRLHQLGVRSIHGVPGWFFSLADLNNGWSICPRWL